jgi:hypothetical protein
MVMAPSLPLKQFILLAEALDVSVLFAPTVIAAEVVQLLASFTVIE